MKITHNSHFNRQLNTKPNCYSGEREPNGKRSDPQLWRDILAFWTLGLCTSFFYVLIICASHDILNGFEDDSKAEESKGSVLAPDDVVSIRKNVCGTPSAGILLLADIVPSMLMNVICPFLPTVRHFRIVLVITLNVTSFLLIANAESAYLAIIGVCFTSMAEGMAEVTLLSYSAQFDKKVLTAWASGTGSAGIISSISWAGLISLGFTPRSTLQLMLVVPIIEAATFWLLLRKPQSQTHDSNHKNTDIATIESNESTPECVASPVQEEKLSGLTAKLKFLPKLSGFILPLLIVFTFEYICVSGLFAMINIDSTWLEYDSQYRWFLVAYQIGVFTSRSLGSFLKPRKTWWAVALQLINASTFMYMASKLNASNPWLVFILIFGIGIIGGLCFIHTFQRVVKYLPLHQQKFSLGMLTVAESFGTALGAAASIPIHAILCSDFILGK